MSKRFLAGVAALITVGTLTINANAAVLEPTYSFVFNFSGQCDDCAYITDSSDPNYTGEPGSSTFNPIGDGVFEQVTATLTLTNIRVNEDGFIFFGGQGSTVFSYGGSSLINPFTMNDPFTFTDSLRTDGSVVGDAFEFASSQNVNSEFGFDFPDFCTATGELVLGRGSSSACDNVGLVTFSLSSNGDWSVSGSEAFDIGIGGQFVSAIATNVAEPLTTAMLGLGLFCMGYARRRVS